MKLVGCLVVGLAAMILAEGQALAQWRPVHGSWWMGPGIMGDWGMGWIGVVFMIAFWVLVILGLVFLIRWLAGLGRSQRSSEGGRDEALEILRERYAKGDIGKEEFEEKKKDLL